jgi:oligopeptide/dipeptide ABC transporter ATP-binding protein
VSDLRVRFPIASDDIEALSGFDLQVHRGEMAAIVGESGSGKSVAAWSILNLLPSPGRIVAGQIRWHGEDVQRMSAERLRHYRGKEVGLILANPRTQLHPLRRVGDQIEAVLRAHARIGSGEANARAAAMLTAVGMPDPVRVARSYPHELSGGMAQRIIIAMALINAPQLVIADEATTSLDVTVQRQVLDLMTDLVHQHGASMLMITHDLGVVAQYCTRVTVMYAGQVVEVAATDRLFAAPLHPYTKALLGTVRAVGAARGDPLPGLPPNPAARPAGCALEPRCPVRLPECARVRPVLREVEPGRWVRCIRFNENAISAGESRPAIALHPVAARDTRAVPAEAQGAS